MNARQFLLDENVHQGLADALHDRWPEIVVRQVGEEDVPSRGTLDPDILIWCEQYGFSLVTNNRTSMPVHLTEHLAAGRHVPGIFVLSDAMTIGQTVPNWR